MMINVGRSRAPSLLGMFSTWQDDNGNRIMFSIEPAPRAPASLPIPAGVYSLGMKVVPTMGPAVVILDVPGHGDVPIVSTNVLGHSGSSPVVGLEIGLSGFRPGTSQPAVDLLRARVEDAINRGEPALICFRDPT